LELLNIGLKIPITIYDENLILLVCLLFETITYNHNNNIN
jgi:hypothetical protein